jgi:hypothetical protein
MFVRQMVAWACEMYKTALAQDTKSHLSPATSSLSLLSTAVLKISGRSFLINTATIIGLHEILSRSRLKTFEMYPILLFAYENYVWRQLSRKWPRIANNEILSYDSSHSLSRCLISLMVRPKFDASSWLRLLSSYPLQVYDLRPILFLPSTRHVTPAVMRHNSARMSTWADMARERLGGRAVSR